MGGPHLDAARPDTLICASGDLSSPEGRLPGEGLGCRPAGPGPQGRPRQSRQLWRRAQPGGIAVVGHYVFLACIRSMLENMGYQFVHFETYSRKPDAGGRSTSFFLDEADRRPSACQHVAVPVAPSLVFGASVSDLRHVHDARTASATTAAAGKARRVRSDQHTLATVVASFPVPWDAVRADPGQADALANWERRTVAWLRDQFGDQVVSVVLHVDENFPHLHAFILPADPPMRAKLLHPGWSAKTAAVTAAKADGANAKEANAKGDVAYKATMRAWQDSYWQAVGLPCGLTRLGPGRRRLTRAQWQTEKSAARTTATLIDEADQARQTIATKAALEARATTACRKAHAAVAEAKARLAEAKKQSDEADMRRHQAETNARRKARAILGEARATGARILADAERRVAPLRTVAGWLGALWAGFRSVEKTLGAAADVRVEAAIAAASAEVAEAKARLRDEARQEVGDLLTRLRRTAADAERGQMTAERCLAKMEAEARRQAEETRQARTKLVTEKSARRAAETERERFRNMWAEADNRLIEMERGGRPRLGV